MRRMEALLASLDIKTAARNFAIPLSSFFPILALYILHPSSFQSTWKGRTFYLFFIWLLLLELILNWEKLSQKNLTSLKKPRIIAICISASIPTVYVIGLNFLGLNQIVIKIGKQIGAFWLGTWPLSLEYLVFTAVFTITIWLAYKTDGLKQFSISLCFLGAIGIIYMIDTFYPYGNFTPFQAFVPFTASSSAQVLNWMGYETVFLPYQIEGTPILKVWSSSGSAQFGIGWPCAGVQSLFIYTFVMLLFLKKTPLSTIKKVILFIIGAIGTYIANILRIASIFIIAVNRGDVATFHNYYGGLYSMTWIATYLLIIILSRAIYAKLPILKMKLQKLNWPK